ncbi:MAG: B12-binding domain-containing radical SAM protein [Eubacteriales bacterium]
MVINMKFLLIGMNAKFIHSNPAIYSLQAYAKERIKDVDVEIAEYTINNQNDTILADIYKKNPDMIGFSCYIWNWNMIQDVMVELHKILPHVDIWLGGPEVSYEPVEVMNQYPWLTGIMVGEGEATFVDILQQYGKTRENTCLHLETSEHIEGNTDFKEVPGIATKEYVTQVRELIALDDIPFFYEDLSIFEHRIIYYESSRGCPFRCSYCLSSIDKAVRLRGFSLVEKELEFFLSHKVSQVKFIDRTFNCNHKHAMAIWKYIHEHDNGITNFHFEVSADIISEEELLLLNEMRPGLVQLEIGVQSTNPATIKEINRSMDLEQLKKVYSRIDAGKNIHQHLDLIAGLPFEDYKTFQKSFNEIYKLHPEQLQLGFLKVLKGAYMHDQTKEYGLCYQSKPPYEVLFTNWLTYGEVLQLKAVEEMVELYYNSNQYVHTLSLLETAFETPFVLYESLARFYETEGYVMASPSRAYRYDVLLQFALQVDSKNVAVYKELLTYDCYLRENMKTRPAYAPSLEIYKDSIREFYKNEEVTRDILSNYQEYNWKQISKMTHGEIFTYPVWEQDSKVMCEMLPTAKLVVFDYKERDPLTGRARTVVV